MTTAPFLLDNALSRLARSYLSVAAKKPQSHFTTGDPLGYIDWAALNFLKSRGLITFDDVFQATPAGVEAHNDFLAIGR